MMSNEFREIIAKRIREVEEKWEKILDQEMQQRINTIKADVDELRKIFKEEMRRFEKADT